MFSKKEIIEILKDPKSGPEIFKLADKVRKENVGEGVHLRGLIEFSNVCRCNCKYCGLRCANKNVERYRMEADDIISCAKNAVALGLKTVVLQSGEDNYFSRDVICKIITEIKKLDVALTLSIGERPIDDYRAFKDAGADRYLLRIETTDEKLYLKMHPGADFKNRARCLKDLKEIGYETGSGCLVGLPGQSIESLADDILFFYENNFDMIGIGPFIPHPDTPLKHDKGGDLELSIKVMALVRILLKDINIPATTAMETISPNGRIMALNAGANVVMPNVTMQKYQKKYEIYPDKFHSGDILKDIKDKISSIERHVSFDKGFRGNKE